MDENLMQPHLWLWRMKDGRTIPISGMDTAHLRNAIAYLANRGAAAALAAHNGTASDAQKAEAEMLGLLKGSRVVMRQYRNMLAELERRDLVEMEKAALERSTSK